VNTVAGLLYMVIVEGLKLCGTAEVASSSNSKVCETVFTGCLEFF